jgi:hypothetical protein
VRAVAPLPFLTRLWFAWVCFFRVLFNGTYAAELYAAPPKALGAGEGAREREAEPEPPPSPKAVPKPAAVLPEAKPAPKTDPTEPALQLLALLQREGRLVDFLEEDVASFPDADIGAAARVVHAGCRKALRDHVELLPVRTEEEGAKVTLAEGFSPAEIKLTGDVQGKGPHTGTLRHRGWRAAKITLPVAIDGHDARVIAQAEVEL